MSHFRNTLCNDDSFILVDRLYLCYVSCQFWSIGRTVFEVGDNSKRYCANKLLFLVSLP